MATYWKNSCSFGLRYVSWYKCLIVGLVFSHLGFWSGNLFLIAPFPDLCLLVPSCFVLFVLRFNVQVNNFSVMSGRSHCFLGLTSTLWSKCVLLKNTTHCCQWGLNPGPLNFKSDPIPVRHRAPYLVLCMDHLTCENYSSESMRLRQESTLTLFTQTKQYCNFVKTGLTICQL